MALKCWKFISLSNNVYKPLRALTYSSLLTLAPFQFHFNAKKEVQTSKYFFVVGILHFLLYLHFYNDSVWGDSEIRLTGLLAMITIIYFAIIKRQQLVNIIQNIIIVDDTFVSLGIKLNNRRIARFNYRVSIAVVILNMIYFCIRFRAFFTNYSLRNFNSLLNFSMPHINITLLVTKFICLTHLAKTRFNMINKVLQEILDYQENSALELTPSHSTQHVPVPSIFWQTPENSIKQLSKVHSLMCDICDAIEEYFTYPLLVTIAISFWFIVFCNFYLLDALFQLQTWDLFLWGCFTQVLWSIAFIFLIVEASCNTIGHSNASAQWVHKILNVTDVPELKDRLSRLSLQLIHRKVYFTAAKLLTLDRGLLLTIAGSATCYLIILMQNRTKKYIEENAGYNYTDYE